MVIHVSIEVSDRIYRCYRSIDKDYSKLLVSSIPRFPELLRVLRAEIAGAGATPARRRTMALALGVPGWPSERRLDST